MIAGWPSSAAWRACGPCVGSTRASSSSPSMARTRAGSPVPSTRTRVRRRSTSSVVGATPRSACSRRVSTSSQSCSEIESLDSRASRPLPSDALAAGEAGAQPDEAARRSGPGPRARERSGPARDGRRGRREGAGAGIERSGRSEPTPAAGCVGGCGRGRHRPRPPMQEHGEGDQDVGKRVLHGSCLPSPSARTDGGPSSGLDATRSPLRTPERR